MTGVVLAPRPDLSKAQITGAEHSPKRFDRDKYRRAFEVYPYSTQPQNFWRDIPGGAFFIPTEKILNLNVSYVDEKGPAADAQRAMRELEAQGLDYDIELFDPSGNSSETQTPMPADDDTQ